MRGCEVVCVGGRMGEWAGAFRMLLAAAWAVQPTCVLKKGRPPLLLMEVLTHKGKWCGEVEEQN